MREGPENPTTSLGLFFELGEAGLHFGQSIGPGGSQFERQTRTAPPPSGARRDEQTRFVSVVLRDTELRWKQLLPQQAGDLVRTASGKAYEEPRLVLFNGSTRSPCGEASAAASGTTGAPAAVTSPET